MARIPSLVIYVPPVDPERVATGELVFTPVTANFADSVDCPPIRKSTVELNGKSIPFV